MLARALIALAGAALLAAPWLPWYGPAAEFLVLFGALDRLDPLVFEARSAWQRLPALAVALTAVGLAGLWRAAVPAVRRLDRFFMVAAASCLATAAAAAAFRPRVDVAGVGAIARAEIGLRWGAWVALAALVVLLVALWRAQSLSVARRA